MSSKVKLPYSILFNKGMSKALFPIEVTLSGITIEVKFVQENASLPIEVTLSGISTVVKLRQ